MKWPPRPTQVTDLLPELQNLLDSANSNGSRGVESVSAWFLLLMNEATNRVAIRSVFTTNEHQ